MKDKKKLGFFDIFNLGVGGTIGSGIFVMMGLGIAFTGRSVSLALFVGCIYMLLAYLFHPIMASMFVLPGGDYDMKAMLYGPTLTGVSAVFQVMNGLACAAYGTAIVDYVGMIFPAVLAYKKIIAVGIIVLFFALTIRGSKFMAKLNNVITVILLVSIALFIVFGLPKVQPGYVTNEGFFVDGFGGFMMAISILAFACQGASITPVAMMSETNNPKRTIPLAIPVVAAAVAIVYTLMGIVASGVLPYEQVAGQPLTLVAQQIFPSWLYMIFVLGGAVFAIASSLMAFISMMKVPLLQVAKDGWLPKVFTKTTKDGYPYATQLALLTVSVLPLLLDFSLDSIVSLTMIPTMLLNCYLNFSLIKLVKEYPEQWEKSVYHMPKGVFTIVCIVAAICDIVVAISLFMNFGSATEIIFLIGIIIFCFAVAILRLKQGAVSKEKLMEKRQAIIDAAVSAE
ncbi:MAG: amino acid permease [Oscillospiraceae bacterium]|nr:amino acid permease [Oscillospiraceae bacterium]